MHWIPILYSLKKQSHSHMVYSNRPTIRLTIIQNIIPHINLLEHRYLIACRSALSLWTVIGLFVLFKYISKWMITCGFVAVQSANQIISKFKQPIKSVPGLRKSNDFIFAGAFSVLSTLRLTNKRLYYYITIYKIRLEETNNTIWK